MKNKFKVGDTFTIDHTRFKGEHAHVYRDCTKDKVYVVTWAGVAAFEDDPHEINFIDDAGDPVRSGAHHITATS